MIEKIKQLIIDKLTSTSKSMTNGYSSLTIYAVDHCPDMIDFVLDLLSKGVHSDTGYCIEITPINGDVTIEKRCFKSLALIPGYNCVNLYIKFEPGSITVELKALLSGTEVVLRTYIANIIPITAKYPIGVMHRLFIENDWFKHLRKTDAFEYELEVSQEHADLIEAMFANFAINPTTYCSHGTAILSTLTHSAIARISFAIPLLGETLSVRIHRTTGEVIQVEMNAPIVDQSVCKGDIVTIESGYYDVGESRPLVANYDFSMSEVLSLIKQWDADDGDPLVAGEPLVINRLIELGYFTDVPKHHRVNVSDWDSTSIDGVYTLSE